MRASSSRNTSEGVGGHLRGVWGLLFFAQVMARSLTTGRAGDGATAGKKIGNEQSILADIGSMEVLFGLLKFRFLSIPAVLDQ